MTNNKTKTAIERLRELVDSDRIQHMGSMHLPPDCILELDARLSTLETSAKASEPNECICHNYRTVFCPVHDNNDEKIGCRVGKSFADPKFVESHLHDKIDESTSVEHCMISKEELQVSISHNDSVKYMNDLIQDRVMHAIRHLIGKININDDLVIKLELVKK